MLSNKPLERWKRNATSCLYYEHESWQWENKLKPGRKRTLKRIKVGPIVIYDNY